MRKITKIWTTRRGKKIRICDMTDTHLENALCMMAGKKLLCNHKHTEFSAKSQNNYEALWSEYKRRKI